MDESMFQDMGGFPRILSEEWRSGVEKDLRGSLFHERLLRVLPGGLRVSPLFTEEFLPGVGRRGGERPGPRSLEARMQETEAGAAAAERPGSPEPRIQDRELSGDGRGGPGRGWQSVQEIGLADLKAAAGAWDLFLVRGADALWLGSGVSNGSGLSAARELNLKKLSQVLEGVESEKTALYLDGGTGFFGAAALLAALASGPDGGLAAALGGFCADPFGAVAVEGGRLPDDAAFDRLARLVQWSLVHAPGMRVLLVSTLPYHSAGASPTLELAVMLATAVEVFRRLESQGVALESVRESSMLLFGVDTDIFVEMAKLRAARILWGKMLHGCGVGLVQAVPVYARCSPRTKTIRDPWVNLLRVTAETFAAVTGGADGILTTPYDELRPETSRLGLKMALNTQKILSEEAGLGRIADPAAGSYAVEALTDRLARLAWGMFQEIEGQGGMAAALEKGTIHRWVLECPEERGLGVREARNQGKREGLAEGKGAGRGVARGDSGSRERCDLEAEAVRHSIVGVTIFPDPHEEAPAFPGALASGAGGGLSGSGLDEGRLHGIESDRSGADAREVRLSGSGLDKKRDHGTEPTGPSAAGPGEGRDCGTEPGGLGEDARASQLWGQGGGDGSPASHPDAGLALSEAKYGVTEKSVRLFLERLREEAAGSGATFETALEAARAGASLGQIEAAVAGSAVGPEIPPFRPLRDAEPYEREWLASGSGRAGGADHE